MSKKMARTTGSFSRPFPVHSLEKALVIIQAIVENGAGKPMDRLLVANAIGRTPSSSEFKRLLSSSLRYGLTNGTEKADYISPTELGLKVAKPVTPEEGRKALIGACMKPELIGRVLGDFNRNKLPDSSFLKNTLERSYKVDPSHSDELAQLIVENAEFCGILKDISGSKYIRITSEQGGSINIIESEEDNEELENPLAPLASAINSESDGQNAAVPSQKAPGKIFVAHGKNTKPVDALKKILDQFKIPYRVAIDEAHAGRPISLKVAQLMDECSAGIFIFTKDELFLRRLESGKDEEVWRPSENMVYELGAASKLWERRIIILKEDGVNFPSDFSDLGYITFDGNDLSNKALELLNELVQLGLVRVLAA